MLKGKAVGLVDSNAFRKYSGIWKFNDDELAKEYNVRQIGTESGLTAEAVEEKAVEGKK